MKKFITALLVFGSLQTGAISVANAGIFTYKKVKMESNCTSADGNYSGKYRVSYTGSKPTIFSSGEGNELTEFKLKNNITGKKYSCSFDLYSDIPDCGREESLKIEHSGPYVFVGINQKTEGVTLNCPDLNDDPPPNPLVPDLVLHVESKAFASIKWNYTDVYGFYTTYVEGKPFDTSYDGSLPPVVGTCQVLAKPWTAGAGEPKMDTMPIQLFQTFSYPANYNFAGATDAFLYTVKCSMNKTYNNYKTNKSSLDFAPINTKLTPQQVKDLFLKSLPAGMVSFSK